MSDLLAHPQGLFGVALAFAAALALTPLVGLLARRWGMVSRPRAERWSKRPTALLGGVAIAAALVLAAATLLPPTPHVWAVLGGSCFLFAVGLVDDLRGLKPYQKLIGQVMGASAVVLGGLSLPWTPSPVVNQTLTLFWLVGITNAVNLLDNMDGLAAGVSAIASAFLAAILFADGQPAEALLMAAFAAALVGFLVFNFNPASIFMGDCGSLFVGFFLASSALLHEGGGRSRGFLAVLAVPVLILVIPIFDTTLVAVLRKLSGRAVSQGGRDHTSHRLVALGLSERRAVLLLYALAALAGLTGLFVRHAEWDVGLLVVAGLTLGLTFLGVHLAGVKVYAEDAAKAAAGQPLTGFLVNLSHKRRVFEVLLDVALVALAYYGANLLVFGPLGDDAASRLLIDTLPVLVAIKLAVFLVAGVYRGLWRYVGLSDLMAYAKGVGAASVVSIVALVLLFRFQGLSRVVFALDGLLLLLLVCGSRLAFRLPRWLVPAVSHHGRRRALIYGAGDAGELLLRLIRTTPRFGCVPVGFADDDPMKAGRVIHGLRVLGGNGSFGKICRDQQVDVVYISSARLSEERVGELLRECRSAGVELKRMRIVVEPVAEDEPQFA
jgi:UDP-GlcNAc:undecaprenyl-phosphate GlcNAc-1-phosphate transferase